MTTTSIDPGNSLAEALDIGLLNNNFQYFNWVGNTDRRDIFKFSTHQVGDLEYSITGLYNNANIQIIDSEGNLIGGSFNKGLEDEFNTFNNLAVGDYYLKVYGVDTTYNLNFKLNLDDAGNTLSQAQDIGLIYQLKHIIGSVNSSDIRDIYKFSTHQVGDLDFSLTGLYNNANIQLLDNQGNLISGSYNTGTQDEFNTYNNLAAGDYYFKIYSSSGTSYELDFKLNLDDAGNTLSQAQNVGLIQQPKHIIGSVGSNDIRDIYKFSTDELGDLDFSLTGLYNNANIQLLDNAGNLISGSYNTGTQDESNTYKNLSPGDYYFKVYSSSGTSYELDFELIPKITTIRGSEGNDTLYGKDRNELIFGKSGKDLLKGYGGDDTIYGGNDNDLINGGDGRDIIHGQHGDDYFIGGNGNDTLYGGNGNDTIQGQLDNDVVHGGNGHDSLYGVEGNDLILGENGDDTLYGGIGDDTLKGGNGNNLLYGDNGNDLLIGGQIKDSMRSGNGNDTLYGYGGQDYMSGGSDNDKLYGGDDHDQIYGDRGDDFLAGEYGIDFMYGGEGRDKLRGGNDRDYLYGEEGNDTLYGDNGNDKLRGGDNNDILIGGRGNDTLIGGLHRDTFLYNTGSPFNTNAIGIDIIEDFENNQDRIYLDKTTFTAISSQQGNGFSNSNEFAVVNLDNQVAGSNAVIVFSQETGNLFYNQNGANSGLGSGGHFVTLFDTDNLAPGNFRIAN